MDILTPAGQQTRCDERRAYAIWKSYNPKYSIIETPKDRPAVIDAFLVMGASIVAVVETKCRYDFDLSMFSERFHWKWLVTEDKIERARMIARDLCVPLVGFLFIVKDDLLLVSKLTNEHDELVVKMDVRITATQACVNGGTATRRNAFIDMKNAKRYEY